MNIDTFLSEYALKCLAVIAAYIISLKPASLLIKHFLKPWIAQIPGNQDDSLAKAGAMIGYLERVLILSFLLLGNDNAIGLVLALKAAYRFKDTEKPHKAEYMLMGTFLSLAITLAIGLATKWALSYL